MIKFSTMEMYIPHVYSITFAILAILILVMYYANLKIKNPTSSSSPSGDSYLYLKEGYISLKDATQDRYRDEYGIEKCSALLNNSPSLCNVDFNTMTQFVDGLRFRKWKPIKEDPMVAQTKSNAEYCYLYDDRKNETQDMILNGSTDDSTCSKQNPIFQSPLITNVFETEFRDRAHQVPIKKCVFEIDPSKLNDIPTVTDFWARIRKQDCHMLSKDLREKLKTKMEQLAALKIAIVNAKDEMQQAKNRLVEKENTRAMCQLANTELERDIDNTREAYAFYEAEVESLNQLLENLQNEIQSLNESIERARTRAEELESQIIAAEIAFQGCENDRARCAREKVTATFNLEETIKTNESIVRDITDLQTEISVLTDKYEVLLEKKLKCDEDLINLNRILDEKKILLDDLEERYKQCMDKNSFYFQEYNRFRDGYITSSNIYFECLDTTEGLSNRLATCRLEVAECVDAMNNLDVYREFNDNVDPVTVEIDDLDFDNLEPQFERIRKRIHKMKEDTREFQKKYDFCVEDSARLVTLIEELRTRKSILQDDLKDAKNKFLLLSTKAYGNMSDDVRAQTQTLLDKYLAMNEREFNENIKRQCGLDFVELEKERDEVENEGIALDNILENLGKNDQTCPSTCDISVSQCIIHHNAPEICGEYTHGIDGVFKVYDKSGNLLETVTIREKGRVEEVKAQDGMEYKFFTFESKKPVNTFWYEAVSNSALNATFKVYDQTDDLVQTINMTRANMTEKVTRTGLTDLKFFTFETDNLDSNHKYQYIALRGRMNDQCKLADPNEYLKGTITGLTRYKKVHLYRGLTCLVVSGPKEPSVTMKGTIINSTEFKRVSLAVGTFQIKFASKRL